MLQRLNTYSRSAIRRFKGGLPKGFIRNVGWQYLSTAWTVGVGFIYTLLVARLLGPDDFGLLAVSQGFGGLIFSLVELRLHEAVIRYTTEFWEQKDYPRLIATIKLALLADVITGMLALGLIVATAPLATQYLIHDSRGTLIVWLGGLALFFMNVGTTTSVGLLRVFNQFKSQTLMRGVGITLNLLLAVALLLWTNWGVLAVTVALAVTNLITNLMLLAATARQLYAHVPVREIHAPIRLLQPRLREMGGFVANTYFLSLTNIPSKDLDIIMLGWFGSLDAAGIYRIAKQFMSAMWYISDPAFVVIYPEIARLWMRREIGAMWSFIKRFSLLMGLLGVGVSAVAFVAVPLVIRWVIGETYAPAGDIFHLMLWSLLFWMPLMWINPLLMAVGRPDLSLKASLLSALMTLLMYLGFVPLWAGYGAALSYGMSLPLYMLMALWLGWRAGLMNTQPIPKAAVVPK